MTSVLLRCMLYFQLRQYLPPIAEGCGWQLSYGSEKHGYSLSTLYRNVQLVTSPVLLVIKSAAQEVGTHTHTHTHGVRGPDGRLHPSDYSIWPHHLVTTKLVCLYSVVCIVIVAAHRLSTRFCFMSPGSFTVLRFISFIT